MVDIVTRGRLDDEDEATKRFISSFDEWNFQPHLAIDRAHVVMLAEQDILSDEVARSIVSGLDDVEADGFDSLPERSDVHVAIEETIVEELGEDIGGQMHTARSRNDKGATAFRIVLRNEILTFAESLLEYYDALLTRAEETADWLVSGYTHLQNAQPTTMGHYLLAHAMACKRDFERLMSAYRHVNESPLGGAAFNGTGFDIDRERTAELLGFDRPVRNSTDAIAARDFVAEAIGAVATATTNLSRLCEDLVIWHSNEFGFVELHDSHAGSSSIMPQKKNPDTPQVARARASTIAGLLNGTLSSLKGVPMSFSYDLVECGDHTKQAFRIGTETMKVMTSTIEKLEFNKEAMEDGASVGFSTATELADTLVRETELSFRTAHHVVGKLAREYELEDIDAAAVSTVTESITGEQVTLDSSKIEDALDPHRNVEARDSFGGPGEIEEALADAERYSDEQWETLHQVESELQTAEEKLTEACQNI